MMGTGRIHMYYGDGKERQQQQSDRQSEPPEPDFRCSSFSS